MHSSVDRKDSYADRLGITPAMHSSLDRKDSYADRLGITPAMHSSLDRKDSYADRLGITLAMHSSLDRKDGYADSHGRKPAMHSSFGRKNYPEDNIADTLETFSVKLGHSRSKMAMHITMLAFETRSIFKKIIVEGYRAVGSLNDSFQSSNFLLLLLLFFIDFGQW